MVFTIFIKLNSKRKNEKSDKLRILIILDYFLIYEKFKYYESFYKKIYEYLTEINKKENEKNKNNFFFFTFPIFDQNKYIFLKF
jgi:hypothetical protein